MRRGTEANRLWIIEVLQPGGFWQYFAARQTEEEADRCREEIERSSYVARVRRARPGELCEQ